VLLAVISVGYYLSNQGSKVKLCALHMSKTSDKVNHYALFHKLMDRSVPHEFLCILLSWYSTIAAYVRWNSTLSDIIIILACGVRQIGVLSVLYM